MPGCAATGPEYAKADGPEVLESFRRHPECTQTPVVVVTSSDAPKDRARVKALGANAYFRKPSNLSEFMALGALVEELVEKSRSYCAYATGPADSVK